MALPRMTTLIELARDAFRTGATAMHAHPDSEISPAEATETAATEAETVLSEPMFEVELESDDSRAPLPEIFGEELGTRDTYGTGDTFSFGGAFQPLQTARETATATLSESGAGNGAPALGGPAFAFESFAQDEGFRSDASMETLGALRPLEGGVVTAGNASQQNDAAAACLVVAEDKLSELGLEPMAYLHSWAAAGCEPSRMGIGPVPATKRVFDRSRLGWDDIGLVELNEAFAPQVLGVLKQWGWSEDDSRLDMLNVNGSGISLGHPIGATGAVLIVRLIHAMQRERLSRGMVTLCIGGGQGIALALERISA